MSVYQDWQDRQDEEWTRYQRDLNWERYCPPDDNPPRCKSCGVPFHNHLGLVGTCRQLQEIKSLLRDWRHRRSGAPERLAAWIVENT